MKPLPYQEEDIEAMEAFGGRVLNASDMGLGKTLETAWLLSRNPSWVPAVVICPALAKPQWENAAEEAGLSSAILYGQDLAKRRKARKRKPKNPKPQAPMVVPKTDLVIINYDILPDWLPAIRKARPRTLVMDEIQFTANGTARTKACKVLAKSSARVIGLSGTPMLSKTVEMYNGLSMIRPDLFRSRLMFNRKYAKWAWTPWGRKYAGARNVKKLHRILVEECMIRRRKEDVLDQLPPKVRRVIPLDIAGRDEYEEASDDFLGWLEAKSARKAETARKVEAMAKVGYLLRLAVRLKIRAAVEWIDKFVEETGQKLVVFAHHVKALDAIQAGSEYQSVRIDGSTGRAARARAVDEFANDRDLMLLVANMKAAGTGLDGLQKACSNVALVEFPWQPGTVLQAEDRVWRMGAKGDRVWAWYLVAHGTIEERLLKVLRSKQGDVSSVLDGEEGGRLDVMSLLIEEMKKRKRRTK